MNLRRSPVPAAVGLLMQGALVRCGSALVLVALLWLAAAWALWGSP